MKTIGMIMVLCFITAVIVFFASWANRCCTNGTMNGGIEQANWKPFIMFILFLIGLGAGTLIYKVLKHKK